MQRSGRPPMHELESIPATQELEWLQRSDVPASALADGGQFSGFLQQRQHNILDPLVRQQQHNTLDPLVRQQQQHNTLDPLVRNDGQQQQRQQPGGPAAPPAAVLGPSHAASAQADPARDDARHGGQGGSGGTLHVQSRSATAAPRPGMQAAQPYVGDEGQQLQHGYEQQLGEQQRQQQQRREQQQQQQQQRHGDQQQQHEGQQQQLGEQWQQQREHLQLGEQLGEQHQRHGEQQLEGQQVQQLGYQQQQQGEHGYTQNYYAPAQEHQASRQAVRRELFGAPLPEGYSGHP